MYSSWKITVLCDKFLRGQKPIFSIKYRQRESSFGEHLILFMFLMSQEHLQQAYGLNKKASRYVKRLLSFMKTTWQYCLTKTTSHTATIESVHQQIDRQLSGKLFYILELRHPLVFTWWSGSLLTLRFRQKLSQFHDLFWSKKGQRSRVVSISWKISLFRSGRQCKCAEIA